MADIKPSFKAGCEKRANLKALELSGFLILLSRVHCICMRLRSQMAGLQAETEQLLQRFARKERPVASSIRSAKQLS